MRKNTQIQKMKIPYLPKILLTSGDTQVAQNKIK